MNAPPSPVVARPHSAFAPFSNRAFRLLWTANVLSNVGGWMQTTGAAWEMTSLTPEPIFVALLAAAGSLRKLKDEHHMKSLGIQVRWAPRHPALP